VGDELNLIETCKYPVWHRHKHVADFVYLGRRRSDAECLKAAVYAMKVDRVGVTHSRDLFIRIFQDGVRQGTTVCSLPE